MKHKLLAAVATTALLAAPTLAHADDEGWYLRGNLGYGAHTDTDITGDIVGDVESEGNGTGSLGIGYDFGNNWRLELDGTSLWTDLGAVSQVQPSFAKLRSDTVMLNALYDFDDFDRWSPYIGAGVGIAQGDATIDVHDTIAAGGNYVDVPTCSAAACLTKGSNTSIAWQLIAGLGYDVTEKLVWDTQYRYQDFADFDYNVALTDRALGTSVGSANLADPGAHLLMTGFRYHFGGKAAAPLATCWDGSQVKMLADCPARPPATQICWDGSEILATAVCPAEPVRTQVCWDGSEIPVTSSCPAQPPARQSFVCPDGTVVFDTMDNCPVGGVTRTDLCSNQVRSEIIYYEFDRGQSPETQATIARILGANEFCSVGSVRVIGHTDTSGSAAYNLALSQRRAKDARDELVSQGVNSAIITSEGKGETEPFIPTGDGVKEQLNRRTEVLITLTELGVIN